MAPVQACDFNPPLCMESAGLPENLPGTRPKLTGPSEPIYGRLDDREDWESGKALFARIVRGGGVCGVGDRGSPSAAAQETLAASCQPTENIFNGATGDNLFAQPFTSQLSGDLTRAELRLRNLSGTGDWIFQIRTAQPSISIPGDLEPTPTVLASATVPDASVPDGTDSTESVVFPNPAAVVAGGSYALSVTRPTATDPNSLAVSFLYPRHGVSPADVLLQ